MQRLHARYPFLAASREAVRAAEVDLEALVREGGPAVERGRQRAASALTAGTVEADPEARWSTRAELLSYPVARVLVSLLDVPGAIEKYARAEAGLAHDRFVEDIERESDLRSDRTERITLRQLLADFGLSSRVTPVLTSAGEAPGRFEVDVTAYLRLASALDGAAWRLVARPLTDGRVSVERQELYTLLREAVRRRDERALPLSVPDPVADALADDVDDLREQLADIDLSDGVETVVPELFPPCMTALLDRARADEGGLADHSRFALLSFCASIGMDAMDVAALWDLDDSTAVADAEYGMARLRDDRTAEFAPPSCATMQAYDDCVPPGERDELCAEIANPLSYYERRLETADDVTDWRER